MLHRVGDFDVEGDSGVTWHVFSPGPVRVVAWPTAKKTFAGYLVQPTSWFTEDTNTSEVRREQKGRSLCEAPMMVHDIERACLLKAYESKLRQVAPDLPEEWVGSVADQLVVRLPSTNYTWSFQSCCPSSASQITLLGNHVSTEWPFTFADQVPLMNAGDTFCRDRHCYVQFCMWPQHCSHWGCCKCCDAPSGTR